MAWIVLVAAGLVEIVMALALKYAEGWTQPGPGALGICAALASFFLLTFALKSLAVATAYAVWTGIGAVGVSLAGILFLGESAHPARLACIAAITGGIVGLRLLEGR
ncbi:MAG TPA: multidrug efflux SMR transporter [Kofleriaceae bacterium]|nr:multidrug efflux SMR transporter [Kofleriaceae bacterium]